MGTKYILKEINHTTI